MLVKTTSIYFRILLQISYTLLSDNRVHVLVIIPTILGPDFNKPMIVEDEVYLSCYGVILIPQTPRYGLLKRVLNQTEIFMVASLKIVLFITLGS